jgi:hypothetical protein
MDLETDHDDSRLSTGYIKAHSNKAQKLTRPFARMAYFTPGQNVATPFRPSRNIERQQSSPHPVITPQ